MNKKIISGIVVLSLLIIFSSIISAGCCEELKNGNICQNVEENECKDTSRFAPTVCSSTSYCRTGTCISPETGKCMINTPKTRCEEQGGVWKSQDPLEIPACQNGCCLYGNNAAYVNNVECKQIASDHGVNVDFRLDISDQATCYALANSKEEGACVIKNEYETNCIRTTKKECIDKKNSRGSSSVSELFDIPSDATSISVEFFPGFLCTAEGLNTSCAATENTICSEDDDKVYFVDSCGNKANVYDVDMYKKNNNWNDEMRDYWTKIQDPKCEITGPNSNSCGDCDYRTGTICATYDKGDEGMPQDAPKYGNKVCRDLSCHYDTNNNGNIEESEKYEHGESWCAETKGTYYHLPRDIEIGGEVWDELISKKGLTEDYNIPGSRYVKLECRNGEVLEQPCKDYRNSICMEQVLAETETGDEQYTQASCVANDWRTCFNITNQSSCESGNMCKWIKGYRFDFKNVKSDDDDPLNMSKQGSCVPLFAPGFNFWESSGTAMQGAVRETVFYEVHWANPDGRNELTKDSKFASQKCYMGGCYAIPGYGSDITESEWETLWKSNDDGNPRDYEYISYRTGHYCHKKDDPEKPKKGGVAGVPECLKTNTNLAPNRDKKRYNAPIFRNHEDWIKSIIIRARSLGDVGYKKSVGNYWSEKSSEKVVSVIQKLSQKMQSKENMTDEFVMWESEKYTDENNRMGGWIGKNAFNLPKGSYSTGEGGGGGGEAVREI